MKPRKFPRHKLQQWLCTVYHVYATIGEMEHLTSESGNPLIRIETADVMDAIHCGRNTAIALMKNMCGKTLDCGVKADGGFYLVVELTNDLIEGSEFAMRSFYPDLFTKQLL